MLLWVFAVFCLCSRSEAQDAAAVANSIQNRYDSELSSVENEFSSSTPPRQAALVARAYRLREFVSRTEDVTWWLNSVAADAQAHPLVRGEALRYLAQTDLDVARFSQAAEKYHSLGIIRHWSLLASPSGGQAGDQEIWQSLPPSPRLWTDLVTPDTKSNAIYAKTSIYSESPQVVALRFGADTPISISVNGVEVFADSAPVALAFDQQAIAVQLSSGWNSVLLRLHNRGNTGAARFVIRVTDLQGVAVQLKTSETTSGNSRVAQGKAQTPAPAVADLVDIAAAESTADTSSAEKLETLGMIEVEHARGSALDHLETAARREPTAERWLGVTEACDDQACTFRALNAALRLDPNNRKAKLALADYYVGRNQLQKARELLRSAMALDPHDFVARDRMVELLMSAELNALALKETRELEALSPSPIWLRKKVAQHYSDLGLLQESCRLLESVLRDSFDDLFARKLLEQLLRRTHDAAALTLLAQENSRFGLRNQVNEHAKSALERSQTSDFGSNYLQDPSRLAEAARQNAPSDNASAVALSDTRIERMLQNGLSQVRVQQVLYIASEQGAHEYRSQNVQFAPASQQLRVLHARIYKPDGSIVEGRNEDDSRVSDASVSMYYDVRSRQIDFPGLQKGDVIELDYTIAPTQTTNPYGDYFGSLVVFRTSIPERLKKYVLISPKDRKLNVVEERMSVAGSVTEDKNERVYSWEVRDLAPMPNEARQPSVTEIAPYVHVSTFSSWSEMGRWYAQMIQPQLKLNPDLRDVAVRTVAGKKSEFEKINAIYQFVLRNTHYVALEFGIYSYKPYPVTQVYQRRFGDCKDKASLMIALLREAGIEADFALLRTRHMGAISDRAVSITLFDHAIVYLPKWDMWLDGTADYFTPGELPVDDQGAIAFVVAQDGSSQLKQIPITRPLDNYTRRTVQAVVAPDGTIHFQGESYTRGEDAPGLRREYEVADRQRDSFRSSLAQVFPSVRVDNVRVHDNDGPERAINVEFSGMINTFVGQRTVSLAPSWMQTSYVQNMAPFSSRTQELKLSAPWTREEELHFQLPDGAQVSLPRNVSIQTKFGAVSIGYERRGREIVVRNSLQFTVLRVSPIDYAAFREFCRTVEKVFQDGMKVELRG